MCCGCLIAVINSFQNPPLMLLFFTGSYYKVGQNCCCFSWSLLTQDWLSIFVTWVSTRTADSLREWVLHCDVWKPFGISCFADSFILKFFLKRVINSMVLKVFITPISFLYPNSTCRFDIRSPVLFSLFIRKQCGTNLLLFMEADTLRHALITFFFFFFVAELDLTLQIRGT